MHLPVPPARFDAAISIAVLHHVSSAVRRQLAVREILRILRPGGRALITVWAREQEDQSLIAKWTPLMGRFTERWAGDGDAESGGDGRSEAGRSEEGLETSSDAIEKGKGRGKRQGKGRLPPLAESERDGDGEEGEEADCEVKRGDGRSVTSGVADGNGGEEKLSTRQEEEEEEEEQRWRLHLEEKGEKRQQERESSEHESHEGENGDYLVPWHLPLHRVEVGSARAADDVASGLAKRDDKKGSVVYHRFYHVFTKGELER